MKTLISHLLSAIALLLAIQHVKGNETPFHSNTSDMLCWGEHLFYLSESPLAVFKEYTTFFQYEFDDDAYFFRGGIDKPYGVLYRLKGDSLIVTNVGRNYSYETLDPKKAVSLKQMKTLAKLTKTTLSRTDHTLFAQWFDGVLNICPHHGGEMRIYIDSKKKIKAYENIAYYRMTFQKGICVKKEFVVPESDMAIELKGEALKKEKDDFFIPFIDRDYRRYRNKTGFTPGTVDQFCWGYIGFHMLHSPLAELNGYQHILPFEARLCYKERPYFDKNYIASWHIEDGILYLHDILPFYTKNNSLDGLHSFTMKKAVADLTHAPFIESDDFEMSTWNGMFKAQWFTGSILIAPIALQPETRVHCFRLYFTEGKLTKAEFVDVDEE